MRRFAFIALLTVFAGSALAGCDGGVRTVAGGDTTTTPPPSTSTASQVRLPPRPATVELDGVDPCELLTAEQQAELRVESARRSPHPMDHFHVRPCDFEKGAPAPMYSYGIAPVTTEGADYWLAPERNVDTQFTTVDGFTAVAYRLKGTGGAGCSMAVDVAEGQMLLVDMQPITRNTFDQSQQCDMAKKAAESAVRTLRTVK